MGEKEKQILGGMGTDLPEISDYIFENHPSGIVICDKTGNIVRYNRTIAFLTGWNSNEINSKNIDIFFRVRQVFETIKPHIFKLRPEKSENFNIQTDCLRKDGGFFPASFDIISFASGKESRFLLFITDISKERESAEKIYKMGEELRQSQKMETTGQITGGIIHYYNNVFTGIIGALGMAHKEVSAETLPVILQAERAANFAAVFTRQILAYSRKAKIVKETVDTRVLVEDAVKFAKYTFDPIINIRCDILPDTLDITGDKASIHQILLNLLVNSRDTLLEKSKTSTGKSELGISIEACNFYPGNSFIKTHAGIKNSDYVCIHVSDNGCGIDSDTIEKIFEPFFTTKQPGSGTGLGLSTTLTSVRQMGGWIDVESKFGEGTRFSIYLPSAPKRKIPGKSPREKELPVGTETVLFVDDDELVRTMGRMTLEMQGYTVIEAGDGMECIEKFIENRDKIKIMILDIGLPVLSGWDTIERIRQIDTKVKIIITTGHELSGNDKLKKFLISGYIPKPFDIADLAAETRRTLDSPVL